MSQIDCLKMVCPPQKKKCFDLHRLRENLEPKFIMWFLSMKTGLMWRSLCP